MKCNITVVGIMQKYTCGYEVLFWLSMGCVSDQSLQNGIVFGSTSNFFKWVSLVVKVNSIKWTWWIKLFSVNSSLERFKWDLLKVSDSSRVNTEVRSHTFGGLEKISRYKEGEKLLIY